MLKIKDTYINIENVLYINKYKRDPNAYNNFDEEYIIEFVFGENYAYGKNVAKNALGWNCESEYSNSKKINNIFAFKDKSEYEEYVNLIENLVEKI